MEDFNWDTGAYASVFDFWYDRNFRAIEISPFQIEVCGECTDIFASAETSRNRFKLVLRFFYWIIGESDYIKLSFKNTQMLRWY